MLSAALGASSVCRGDTAYGSLSNFDVVNDTGQTCYGFEIELDDIHSTDVTYTYDWNHYGAPKISEDSSDPLHPKVFIRHEGRRNADGSFASFTNPQDPAHPIGPTGGHACTDPTVNLGCEHFGVGLYRAPSVVKYHWLVQDPLNAGQLVVGPPVTISAPVFVYIPAVPPPVNAGDPPAAPARVQAVIEPPEAEEPQADKFGVPVWVKVFKTVQPAGKKLKLAELLTDDEEDPDDENWDGDEVAETEIEWQIFQKHPAGDPNKDELEAGDDLPNGDEAVTRRYEFYVYNGPTNPEDGEADCDNPDNCPDAIGPYIGAQMAGFNVEAPLGLIDHLQDGKVSEPYVSRTVVVGGNTPYRVRITSGALPDGLQIDPATGILDGTPTKAGLFEPTIEATDADATVEVKAFSIQILTPLSITTAVLPDGKEGNDYHAELAATGGQAPYVWSVDSLPTGLGLGEDGVLAGKAGQGTAGVYHPTFSVTDGLGDSVSLPLSLKIAAADVRRGDLDQDDDVDRDDLALVMAARNTMAAGPNDPRDLDKDGRITVRDARICVTLFTRPGGATH